MYISLNQPKFVAIAAETYTADTEQSIEDELAAFEAELSAEFCQ